MTTLSRKMRRAKFKRSGDDWPAKERPFRLHPKATGYDALHPTKGWRRISGQRLRAQAKLRAMAELLMARRRAA